MQELKEALLGRLVVAVGSILAVHVVAAEFACNPVVLSVGWLIGFYAHAIIYALSQSSDSVPPR